jgi:AcrR family transcriptional regulator
MSDPASRPLGRPKDGDSSETRSRLLAGAQAAFAQNGFDATTNKEIAAAAGVTTAAIYHYFPSKTELYVAVFESLMERVVAEFRDAVAGQITLIGQFGAVLDRTVELNRDDPTFTGFVVGAAAESGRRPELSGMVMRSNVNSARFYGEVVRSAVERGELDPGMAVPVQDLMIAVLTGLTRFSQQTGDPERLRGAVTALKMFFSGTLLRR